MLPSLLFLLLRHYQQKYPEKAHLLRSRFCFAARVVLLLLLTTGIALYAFSQERMLQYTIKRSGRDAGNLVVKESKAVNRITYELRSVAKTSFLFTISVDALEQAVYENGVLTYSRFYQKVNGWERANTEIRTNGKGYVITSDQEAKPLNSAPIAYNMVCLYTIEPLNRNQVFVDKFQRFVPIENTGPHRYKIKFPDGNSNEYYYEGGTCIRVKLNNTWFNAEMELRR